ncbi:hypothetical protein [Streptomyces sp.]|uniref:hypothetical protein n=1 Tax=Streptomyces sp. TaxID=1931 RepID=UPI002F3F99DD
MHHRATTAAAALSLAALLTACSSSDSDDKAGDAPASTTAASGVVTTEPAPSATPTRDAPLRIGQKYTWKDTATDDSGQSYAVAGNTTVLGYQQPVATSGPTPQDAFGDSSAGYVWAAVDVKVCDTTGKIIVTNTPWALSYADDSLIEPSSYGYDSFPRPAFPMGDTDLTPGRCLRGKIVFPVPGNQRPLAVVYSPGSIGPVLWAVRAS